MKCNILKDFLREFNQNENLRIKIIAAIFFQRSFANLDH